MRLSLMHNSSVIPSCNKYSVSHGRATRLMLRPFIVLTKNLSASFDVNSAPSGNIIVFFVCQQNIYSTVEDLSTRLVERVLT